MDAAAAEKARVFVFDEIVHFYHMLPGYTGAYPMEHMTVAHVFSPTLDQHEKTCREQTL
jgi:hypothetical protein